MAEHDYSWKCNANWTCSEYQGREVSGNNPGGDYPKISKQCSQYTGAPQSRENYNGRGKNYRQRAYCSGHRAQNEDNLPTQPIQNFENRTATAKAINTLRDMIDSEIDNRRKHIYYNGQHSIGTEIGDVSEDDTLKNTKKRGDNIETTYPNAMNAVLSSLLETCENIFNKKETCDYGIMENYIKNLDNVSQGDLIEKGTVSAIQEAVISSVKDCICYSDCNNFGVCNCYGHCNCNY